LPARRRKVWRRKPDRLAHIVVLGASLGPGRDQLDDKTVFVLDEAGMVSSRQMAQIVEEATSAGRKLVLIGDPEQLQPIEAGAAFRAIADRIGYAELETIYRQREQWMRDASLDLARGNIGEAVAVLSAPTAG
jgi:ATP-dependent exoDNAse (exonuclease V) alpha subunit